jgi:hypothetical protein
MVDNKPKVDNFTNVNSMLKKVYNWMDHLNPYHHGLGAVMVTYHMYFVLKKWKHCGLPHISTAIRLHREIEAC